MTSISDRAALLMLDVQPGIVERLSDSSQFLERARTAVRAARAAGMPVIHVVVGFRPGMPEVSDRNQSFATLKQSATPRLIDPAPAIAPERDEIIVVKRRVSAFTGSDLEVILRAGNIQHLILAGIATSGVVLSTLREAADKDYRVTVLADVCGDSDPEVHRVLIDKVFPRQATVTKSDDLFTTV